MAALGSTSRATGWPTCRRVPRGLIAAFARTIFAQPDAASAHQELGEVAEHLRTRFPKAAEIMLAAEDDVLAYTAVPREH